ncbi:hypothetical protein Ocin01_06143 [Orchesella cincta]|uniref:Uncharacterized protein n=1 Tax=Orchesella cincta TaxID=48709 RepID=A0A1D2N5M5_ORCCI|nr:hypothetical protein Ocin01_06143 [Orchesella cincta]
MVKDKDKRAGISPSAYMQLLRMKEDSFELAGKYRFRNFKVIMTDLALESNLEFWNRVGSSIDKLEIMETRGTGAMWRQVLFTLTPNVTELSLKNNLYGWDYYLDRSLRWEERLRPRPEEIRSNLTKLEIIMKYNASRFPVNWITLLGRFPNLQSLKIQGTTVPPRRSYWTPNTADGNVACFFESMLIIRENLRQEMPGLPPLRHLDILNLQLKALNTLPATIPTLLQGLALPISSLALDILERLVAYRAPYCDPFEDFPFGTDLPLLTELQLIGPICKNLDFLARTPKLKILLLWNGNNQMKEPPPHSYCDYALPHITQKKVKGKNSSNQKTTTFSVKIWRAWYFLPWKSSLSDSDWVTIAFEKFCEVWKDKLQYLDVDVRTERDLTTFRIGLSSVHWTLGQLTPRMIRDGLFAAKLLENVTIVNSPVGILNHIDKDLKEKFLDKFPQ